MELCIAKGYMTWKGHEDDALLTYNNTIKKFPEDFRGYLSKGLYYQRKGQFGLAERNFIYARFRAPRDLKDQVDKVIRQAVGIE